jgi:hypothetical protein
MSIEQPGNDVAHYEPDVREITTPTTGSLQRLEAEAESMDKAFKIAKALSATSMVPEHFQRNAKPRGCTDPRGDSATWDLAAAILYGSELGLTAAQSAQNIFVVAGKPAVYARTMAAQVRRAGYKIEEVEATDQRVVWRAERDGKWATSEWTMERASQAGYTSNARYQTNPQEMLRAKCIAEVCRIQYQDVLLGMAYSVEELQLDNVTVQRVVRQAPRGGGMSALREIASQSAEESPPPAPAPQPEPEPAPVQPEGAPPSNEQLEQIRKLYKARNITGQAVLDEIGQFLQRDAKLTSLHKISKEDAQAVLDSLQTPPE